MERLEDRVNPVTLDFALPLGAAAADEGRGIAVDPAGNIYVTGTFQGTVDFDPGAGTFNLVSAGAEDIFVAKYTTTGALLWAGRMGGGSIDVSGAIAVDAAGNVYTTGYFRGTPDFDPGPGTFTLNVGVWACFVSKLDSAGNFVWADQLGSSGWDFGHDVEVDAGGNVYVTGRINATSDFDPGPGTFNLVSGGADDAFVCKLDSAGGLVWAHNLGGTGNDWPLDIAVDAAGAVHTVGFFSGTGDFDPGAGTFNLASAGSDDIFLSKLDTAGNFVWANRIGGSGDDDGYGIAVDAAGNVYASGKFNGTVDFDPGAGTFNLSSAGGDDAFLCKLDSAGNFVWADSFGGTGTDSNNRLAVDAAGNVCLIVNFNGTADFDPGPATFNLTSAGSVDVALCLVDGAGSLIWAGRVGGTGSDTAGGIFMDAVGNIYAAGIFNATSDFDPGPGTVNATSAGSTDIFVVKLLRAGVTIVESAGATNVTEGGATDSYTVVLSSIPTADVLVTLAPDSQLSITPTTLTFTTANWNIAQTVAVTAVDDAIFELIQSGTITHTVTSADAVYNGLTTPSVTATVSDNDLAGILSVNFVNVTEAGTTATYPITLSSQPTANVVVTVNPSVQVTTTATTLTFTPLNWNIGQNITVTAVDDAAAEGAHSGIIAHTSTSSDPNYNAISVNVTANVTDNDTAGVTITQTAGSTDVAESGTTDTYLVVLATQPMADVLVTLSPAASLSTTSTVLTFTTANWNATQTVTLTAIDDVIFQGPHTGVVTHTATSADALYNALSVPSITANIADNDATPGIFLTQPGSPQEGATTSYTIVLQTVPGANVTVNLAPDAQVNVAPASLTFTSANWNVPQTVSVTTVDDTLSESNQTGIITHTISSADAGYNALTVSATTVHIVDNDGTQVLGTEHDDRILVNFIGTRVQAIVNGMASWLSGPVTQILVLANEGNDFVQITAPAVPVVVLGGAGEDAVWVVGSAGYNTFVLDATAVTLNNRTVSIGEAESFVLGGRTSNDTFRIQNLPTVPTELKGDRGNDNVLAPDIDNAWHITAPSGGTLNSTLTLNAVENWYGGTGADTFTFADKKSVAGTIDGGGGSDTLDYSAYTAPVTVNFHTRVATGVKSIANITSLHGGLASDKLIGRDQSNVWSLTDFNAGDVNGILFDHFENLTGGKLDDAFTFADAAGITGKLDGGAGLDALDYSARSTAIAIHLQARTATGTGGMFNFEQFTGGSGIDTLVGQNAVSKWTFTATGTGTLNKFTFGDFENFTGGSSTDTFTLAASLADWLGSVDGGSGRDSLLSFASGVNLWTNGATGVGTLNSRAFAGIELRR